MAQTGKDLLETPQHHFPGHCMKTTGFQAADKMFLGKIHPVHGHLEWMCALSIKIFQDR